ncbi:hypothetical protein CSA56_05835 [candidate division KSB3 bacterium]|uniref:PatA-like N-terminal domain-containing protein n=1 Tax=candidate division KSB3 bacterium TaxID=2044937 RepID=A0A2G6KHA7_9BACT|nr:MAG: hypothetical protein CSA56_05835 [candidate division KSB3 bacterium]
MKGDLAKIGVADIVKALALIGKSGKLSIRSEGRRGTIYLKSGNVISAEDGRLRGEDALYSLAVRERGYFEFEPALTLVDQNIRIGSESLFIGLSSQVDRYKYMLLHSPKLDDRLLANVTAAQAQYDKETQRILRLLNKPLSLREILRQSPYSRILTLEIISQLYAKHAISLAGKTETIPSDEREQEAEDAEKASLETSLKTLSIGEVVQILVLIHRNGRLTATWDDRKGDVFVEHGNITFATVESLEGLGAVYRLLTWKDGYCKFFADVAPESQNIQKNIESIFVEGIDILAKFNKFMDEFPSLDAFIDVISVTGQEEINEKEAAILKTINQHETLNDVITHSPYSDVETLEITAKLYAQRMVGLSKGLRGQQQVDYDKEAEDLLKDLL